uniref:Uncharacterized protein n=1 Tax=Fervidobacterium pennivorans TaxID=93466 RepID=A0A7C4RYH4_FERPE
MSSSPAIGPDGTVYVGSYDGYLYTFQTLNFGLSDSSWRKFRSIICNTGRYGEN